MKKAILVFVLAASCSSRPAPSGQTSHYDSQCTALHKSCTQGGPPCCGGFCSLTGYISGTCEAPLPDGSYCQTGAECASGSCVGYQCGTAPACAPLAAACKTDAECCSGTFCDNLTYAPWVCTAPVANGASCEKNSQCASGICQSYQCTATACVAEGAQCKGSADCCAGGCDTNAYVLSWHTCLKPLSNGSYCSADKECASGICQNYQCVAQACSAAVGASCKLDADCCGGAFCDNATYAPPSCTAPWSKNHYCNEDRQCQTSACVSYQCQ